jgi:NAD(P)-dependent dehydrogenase (short-subunit alcohol dehydrogenase family)
MKQRDVDRMIDLNVRAPVALLDAGADALKAAGREHGQAFVILTSSLSGIWPTPDFAVYSATKAVLVSLARSVNVDLVGDGVRACALCPGFVDTPLSAWVREQVGADAMLQPEDIGEAVRFLLRLSPTAIVSEIVIARAGARHGEP